MSKHRLNIGARLHLATFYQHNGNTDDLGQPTYTVDTDWLPVVINWPVEKLGVSGGETLRGRQVASETTHVLFGEAQGGLGIMPKHRCEVTDLNGSWQRYQVTSVLDRDGINQELRVEIKRQES